MAKIETSITITALWLRRIGDEVQVLVERDGQWYRAITENVDAPFSWIAEGNGAHNWKLDDLTSEPSREAKPTRIVAKDGHFTIGGKRYAVQETNGPF